MQFSVTNNHYREVHLKNVTTSFDLLCGCHHAYFLTPEKADLKRHCGEFSDSPGGRTPRFHGRGHGFDPWWGD